MTNLPNNPLEQQLTNKLRKAETLYRRALAGIQASLPHDDGSSEEITACLTRLQPFMEQVQEMEAELVPLRQEWLKRSRRPGPELQAILDQHEHLLKTLIGRIDTLEQSLQRHRKAAIPGVDRFVKHQQMQKAYQQISR